MTLCIDFTKYLFASCLVSLLKETYNFKYIISFDLYSGNSYMPYLRCDLYVDKIVMKSSKEKTFNTCQCHLCPHCDQNKTHET